MAACADCGFKGRLYRPYGEFLRIERIKCLKCLSHLEVYECESSSGEGYVRPEWHVPARVSALDDDGNIYSCWGNFGGPESSILEWLSKAENTPAGPLKYKEK